MSESEMVSSIKKSLVGFLALVGLSGCTASQVAYLFVPVPSSIGVHQVHWRFNQISPVGCPNLDGVYLVEKSSFSGGLGSGVPGLAFGPAEMRGNVDVELSIVEDSEGYLFISKYQGAVNEKRVDYSELFGCQDGYLVYKSAPYTTRPNESGDCKRAINREIHMALNDNGDLVSSVTRWSRCWLSRFGESSGDDVGPQINVHPRVR